ncbi:MAG: 6-carboxytetrahydropterin synthase QueD [Syntrophomonadaceae bacterium]
MPYHLSVSQSFDAAHFLNGYPGNCANIHGHTWKVEVTIIGSKLDSLGMVVDFREVREKLAKVLEQFDHVLINEIAPFDRINPTSENLAYFIFKQMKKQLEGFQLKLVKVWESENTWVAYEEGE